MHDTDAAPADLSEIAAHCACRKLRSAARTVTRAYDRALEPVGLTSTQFTILVALSQAGPISITALAALLATDRTTLTRNLRPMARDGLLEIAAGKGRARQVRLTSHGRSQLERGASCWAEAQAAFVGALGAASWEALEALLGTLGRIER